MTVIKTLIENMLRERWKSLGLPLEIGEDLIKRYNEPHRHYHNINHLHDCFIKFDSCQYLFKDTVSIQLAIWFHDAIWNPLSKVNEVSSANLFERTVTTFNTELIKNMILSTEKHFPLSFNQDLLYFLDIDLSILGANKSLFRKYEENICKEYSHVEPLDYLKGRSKILQKFLEREPMFYTKEMKLKYEKRARRNLNGLVTALNSAIKGTEK